MVSDDVDNFLAHLSRKRARDEEENKKKMTIILSTITCIIAIVGAWYNENYLVKEPSREHGIMKIIWLKSPHMIRMKKGDVA
ncbi:PREDICTED: PRUPE_1G245300 [Prunus dulcis]|uniref:PREDICTED: PRUPE_1G245300 n=1 Tax=Prunus dulcis TaxID=3755 RepID=A0A5E4GC79_PRUDU|nr:PREDICTED: PRUPE_1G245300 [Prunus dulcis]